jgi:hypothetical protein
MTIIIIAIIWYVIGLVGFIYWETSKCDIKYSSIPFMMIIASLGPVVWIIGWDAFGTDTDNKVFIKRRTKKE